MVKKRTSVNANFLHNNDYKSQHLIGVDTKSVERFFNKEEWYIENQELTPPLTQEEAKDFYTRERGGKQCL